jgi:hypothetical protein
VNFQQIALVELLRILALVYLFAVAAYLAVRCMDIVLGFEEFQDWP